MLGLIVDQRGCGYGFLAYDHHPHLKSDGKEAQLKKTEVIYHKDYEIAPVDPRIFGGFLEHMGRAVYQGVYDPESVHADSDGFRKDVLEAMKPMMYTAMRYPGGNFASGYHWMDGIGSKNERPTVRELAWQSLETNQFGTDEFVKLSRMMDWTPMMTVNLGTGTPEEARNWVEYCNSPTGSLYSNMRAANGSTEPYDLKLWCLGNEMDGPWQLGHVPADQYAIRAQQAAKLMKDVDPFLELDAEGVASGDHQPSTRMLHRSVRRALPANCCPPRPHPRTEKHNFKNILLVQ